MKLMVLGLVICSIVWVEVVLMVVLGIFVYVQIMFVDGNVVVE